MKITFVAAMLAAVFTQVEAKPFSLIKPFFPNFPTTRQEALQKYGTKGQAFKTTPAHKEQVDAAHHNLSAQRKRLGMEPFKSDRALNLRKSYEEMTGINAIVLGTMYGLQYNPAAGYSKCFTATEGVLNSSGNLFFVLTKTYMPWYVPEAQLVVQDFIALNGGFYTECDLNKFFDSMTTLFSDEGLSQAGARATATYPFEYRAFTKAFADPDMPSFIKYQKFGKLFGAVTNYYI